MKRLTLFCLVCTLLLGLVACTQAPEISTSGTSQAPTTSFTPCYPSTTTVPPTTIPTTAPITMPTTVPTTSTVSPYPGLDKASDFTVYDNDKEAVSLSDFAGKPVVLNFWASWCNPCKSEMPAFQDAYETYGEEIQFMMVNMTDGTYETRLSASTFIQQMGYTFPVFYDPYYSAVSAYSIKSIPTTFFINADGYIVASIVGAINSARLRYCLDLLLEQ